MNLRSWGEVCLPLLTLLLTFGCDLERHEPPGAGEETCFHHGLASDGSEGGCGLDLSSACSPVSVFEGPETAEAKALVRTSDGGYVLVGFLDLADDDRTDYDAFIVRTNASGTELWGHAFDTGGFDYAEDVIQTADGGFLLVGYSVFYGDDPHQALVIRLDAEGNELWRRLLGGDENTTASTVLRSAAGHFVVGGGRRVYHENGYGPAAFLAALDDEGEELWTRGLGEEFLGDLSDIVETPAGELAFVVERYRNATITVASSVGEPRWSEEVVRGRALRVRLALGREGGFIVTSNDGERRIAVQRLERGGALRWSSSVSGVGLDVARASTGEIFVVGHHDDGSGPSNVLVVQLSEEDGRERWRRTYGGMGEEVAWDVTLGDDGTVALAGSTTTGAQAAEGPAMRAFLLLADERGEIL